MPQNTPPAPLQTQSLATTTPTIPPSTLSTPASPLLDPTSSTAVEASAPVVVVVEAEVILMVGTSSSTVRNNPMSPLVNKSDHSMIPLSRSQPWTISPTDHSLVAIAAGAAAAEVGEADEAAHTDVIVMVGVWAVVTEAGASTPMVFPST